MFKTEPSGMSSHLGNPKTWWIFPDTLLLLIFSLISLYSEDMLCLKRFVMTQKVVCLCDCSTCTSKNQLQWWIMLWSSISLTFNTIFLWIIGEVLKLSVVNCRFINFSLEFFQFLFMYFKGLLLNIYRYLRLLLSQSLLW